MRLNPEFRRNLVLEMSTHRLLAMPGMLLLAFLLAYALGSKVEGLNAVGWTGFGLFGGITVFWGTQLATSAVLDEFRDKTWDTQRLSALGPWTLAWGKLMGGTVFAWYGGIICLPVFVIGTFGGSGGALSGFPTLALAALMVGAAILMHALGLLSGVLLLRGGQRRSSVSIALLLFAVFAAWPLISSLFNREPIQWWGLRWDSAWFSVVSCWLFAAWAVMGVYRTLCTELQVRTMPVAWTGLAAFLSLYLTGFLVGRVPDESALTLFCAVAFVVTLSMSYVSVWVEKRDVISVRRLLHSARSGDRRRALQEMPCWLATMPLALLAALFLFARGDELWIPGMVHGMLSALPMVAALLALRDIALLYFFSFAKNPRNAETTAVIYLLLFYWLLPSLLTSMGLTPIAQVFLPHVAGNALFAVLVSAAQAALLGWLALARWRRQVSALAPGKVN